MRYFRVATFNTPEVTFDLENGFISFIGKSTSVNSLEFYKNLIDEIKYCTNDVSDIDININLNRFNTCSAKCIFDILRALKQKENAGNKISVNWFYERQDSDMLEMGKDFSELLELKFQYLEQSAFLTH
jgi:hypothetical protein